jgi:hypothetical protein
MIKKKTKRNPNQRLNTLVQVGDRMQQINFRLWRDRGDFDWTLEVNGSRYESVPMDLIERLVQHAIIDAEETLTAATIH